MFKNDSESVESFIEGTLARYHDAMALAVGKRSRPRVVSKTIKSVKLLE
jgi:hypothetical protein